MFKKGVILVTVLFISLAFADFVFGNQHSKTESQFEVQYDNEQNELVIYRDIFESSAPSTDGDAPKANPDPNWDYAVDTDNDGLTNKDEIMYGTNPFLPDTDSDFLIDSVEIKAGTDPLNWDTDGDFLADYMELGPASISTNPFLADSDHDGLEDPWEDNDGDTILNIEEQHPKFKYGILGTNPNEVDSDGDNINDDIEIQANAPGPISKNAKEISGYTTLSITPDRLNNDLDVSNKNSKLSKHLKTIGWTDADLDKWAQGLSDAYDHGVLTIDKRNTVWYHYTPYLWPMPTEYNWSTGTPYRWNKYDTNPAVNDTDGDIMDDDWDIRPLMPDDRLDSYIAIRKITYQNKEYAAQNPHNGNFTGGIEANFSNLEVKKGDQISLEVWLGLEESGPASTHIQNGWWHPINISISFGEFLLGSDNTSHGPGINDFHGDDIWPDFNDTSLPSIPDKPWVKADNSNYETVLQFKNNTGVLSDMYFYSQIITIYLPTDLPAGIVGFIVRANPNTGENFHYESYTFPFIGY